MSDLFNEEKITLDKLREAFHNNDFSTLPVKDPSEYNEKELKLYNRVLTLVNAEWKTISKSMGLSKSAKEFSCDEDFNQNKALNYPKMDHDKKWNHTRAKMKVVSLDEIAENSPNGEPPQVPDKTNVEATADIHILVENNTGQAQRGISQQ